MVNNKLWLGTPPGICDLCGRDISKTFVDGATQLGVWALMCMTCHTNHGNGLGTGKGQKYQAVRRTDRLQWELVEGGTPEQTMVLSD